MFARFEVGCVPNDVDVIVFGKGEVAGDDGTSLSVKFGVEGFEEGGGGIASGPEDGAAGDEGVTDEDAILIDFGNDFIGPYFDTHFFKVCLGFAREVFVEWGEDAVHAFDEDDLGGFDGDFAEVLFEGAAGKLGDGAGELNTCWACADDAEGEVFGDFFGGVESFGSLKGGEEAIADEEGVRNGLKAWGELFPLGIAKVGMAGACGDN
ncbi:MAG: hypothetical protein S4CHLAM102_11340 [Chlamydiia bacterium]|nr:hypothetical protein [Chlamydiia bacterium]